MPIWFGHFYEPAYSDASFVKRMMKKLSDLGFTTVVQDAKDWEDLRDRCLGGKGSPYTQMLETMQKEANDAGLTYTFLLLYLNGDNLYPDIRFSAPIRAVGITGEDGTKQPWYFYGNAKEQERQAQHVREMLQTYGKKENGFGSIRLEDGVIKKPVCSMWDPIAVPDFGPEGTARYHRFLKDRYHGSVDQLNAAYRTAFSNFDGIPPEEYWFTKKYPGETAFTRGDFDSHPEKIRLLSDNRLYTRRELVSYFQQMQKRIHLIDSDLYTVPNLAQWGYFLNIDGAMLSGVGMADLWDTAVRGIDLYEIAPYVDVANFLSVPVTPYGDPDAYVVSASHSMLRVMNRGRDFLGGIFWGRFLYNDVYSVLTPEEIVGSIAASGAGGYASYGVCGMDDGGLLHRMPETFCQSLARANRWMNRVMPLAGRRKPSEIAILFPTAMASCESMQTKGNKERRLDLLGWYQRCLDLGYSADILDRNAVLRGELASYRVLIVPADDCYDYERMPEVEDQIRSWLEAGGTLLHGPEPSSLLCSFGIYERKTDLRPVRPVKPGEDVLIPQGPVSACLKSAPGSRILAAYDGTEETAVMETPKGQGRIFSFGFLYGFSEKAKIAPHVPRSAGNREMYPLPLSNEHWVQDALHQSLGEPEHHPQDGLEQTAFENGWIAVNHTSYPMTLWDGTTLPPRSSIYLGNDGTHLKSLEEEGNE